MTIEYEKNPHRIEQDSFNQIRKSCDLRDFDLVQSQVVMRIVHSIGMPEIANAIRFSSNACSEGLQALKANKPILCDVEMVKHGITKRLIKREPQCFLHYPEVEETAKKDNETRCMAAVSYWRPYLQDSIAIIGNAPTALYRLLEIIENTGLKPALLIAMPVGFVGAAESKQLLWDKHQSMDLNCVTLLGRQGGSALASACCNALLRVNAGELY